MIKKNIAPFLLFAVFIGLWESSFRLLNFPGYIIPLPSSIFIAIVQNFFDLLWNLSITLLEAFLGFLIANIAGISLAIVFINSPVIEKSVFPYTVALKAIPLVAIAPLLTLWFGNGISGKIIMAALICFFPIVVNATAGLKSPVRESIDLMNSFNASKLQILMKLRLPVALPYIFSALKISSTLSVIGAIVAELAGAKMGIGFIILISSYKLETDMVFAAILASSSGGILFFKIVSKIEEKIIHWHESVLEPTD